MTKQLLHHLWMQSGVQRQRRAGVPRVVQPDDGYTGPLRQCLEELAEPVGVVAAAVSLHEYEPALG